MPALSSRRKRKPGLTVNCRVRSLAGLCRRWGSKPRTAAMRGSADVGEKGGSNGRLLHQAMSAPDPKATFAFFESGRSLWVANYFGADATSNHLARIHCLMTQLAVGWMNPGLNPRVTHYYSRCGCGRVLAEMLGACVTVAAGEKWCLKFL